MTAMFDAETHGWETMTDGNADEFLNRKRNGPDDDEDGEDDETILAPVQPDEEAAVVRCPNELVSCPCPPLEPYPDEAWLSLPQWELIAAAEHMFGSAKVKTNGASVWVPIEEKLVRSWVAFGAAMAAGCGTFQPAFGGEVGTWIDTTPLGI